MPECRRTRLRSAVVTCCALFGTIISHSAFTQQQSDFDEEIIVRGESSRRALRIQIQRAELAVYERFNEINTTDDFDIRCQMRTRYLSTIKQRTCVANFERESEQRVARELARQYRAETALNVQAIQSAAQLRKRQMEEEMARLFAEDSQLRDAFVHVADLQQTLDETGASRKSRESIGEDVGPDSLPFGASVLAEAEIGRNFWVHELTYRTFTIADLDGALGLIRLRCRNADGDFIPRDLEISTGVEWAIPQSWGPCSVRVTGRPGTTFSLYEFEQ